MSDKKRRTPRSERRGKGLSTDDLHEAFEKVRTGEITIEQYDEIARMVRDGK